MTTKTSNHNSIRLNELLIVARSALRDALRSRHPPDRYDSVLKTHEHNLKNNKHCPELRKLFTDSEQYTGDFDEFDISCLYTLLREIGYIAPHNNGWGKEPQDSDNSMSAHIERLRLFRNKIAHSNNESFSNENFTKEWSKLHTSIVEVGGQKYHNIVNEKLNSTGENSNIAGNLSKHLVYPYFTILCYSIHCL